LKAILILCVAFVAIAAIVLLGLRIVKATRLWPAAILIVTAPLEVYRSNSGVGLNVSLFRIALAVAALAFALDLARGRRRLPRVVALPFIAYALLLVWQLISLAFITSNHSLAYRFVGQYVAGLLAALLVICYLRRDDLRIAAAVFGAAAVIPLVAAAYRVFSVDSGGSGDLPGLSELPVNLTIEAGRQTGSVLLNGTQRLNATFADPNQFGFYIATVFLIVAGATCARLATDRPVCWRTASSFLSLMLATGLAAVGTYSRSTWLLAAAGAIALAALLGRGFWTRRRAIVVGVAATIAFGLASPLIASRLNGSEGGNVKSTQVHEHTMRIALKLIAHHPLTGVGLGGYGHYANQPPIISSSVSTFLTVGAELGILGMVLLIAAILITTAGGVRSVVKSTAAERAVLAGFVAAFIGLALANVIGEVWMNDFQWVLFGSLIAVTKQPGILLGRGSLFERAPIQPARAASEGAGVLA
jgi:hypothetical protein